MLNFRVFSSFSSSYSQDLKTCFSSTYFNRGECLFLLHFQPLEKPFQLLECNLFDFGWIPWPLEFHSLQQLLVCQDKSVFIIPQDFDGGSSFVTEDEYTFFREWIKSELQVDNCHQSIYLFTEIGRAALDKNMRRIFCKTI